LWGVDNGFGERVTINLPVWGFGDIALGQFGTVRLLNIVDYSSKGLPLDGVKISHRFCAKFTSSPMEITGV